MISRSKILFAATVVAPLALVGIAVPVPTAEAFGSTIVTAGQQCIFNDDCHSPLVCKAYRCRAQCRTDRDCAGGWTCDRRAGQEHLARCIAPPAAPPPLGFIMGRVEDPPGVSVTRCTVLLDGVESRIARRCDARGQFSFDRVTPGFHELTVVPGFTIGGPQRLQRTIGLWVDPGMHAHTGAIVLPPAVAAPAPVIVPQVAGPMTVPTVIVPQSANTEPPPEKK